MSEQLGLDDYWLGYSARLAEAIAAAAQQQQQQQQ
jgi:hypothetical protein